MPFSQDRAPKWTRVAASQTDSLIESGNTITVYAILIEASANSQVTIEESDGATVIMTPRVLANDSQLLEFTWLADQGLAITTPANCTATVFHSQAGS